MSFTVGGESKARTNVIASEFRKIVENFGLTHSSREIFENILDRDPQSPNTGFPAPLPGVDGDNLAVVHPCSLKQRRRFGKLLHLTD